MKNINPNKIISLLLFFIVCFSIFIFPIKLGAPYIDEIGLYIPTLIELIFASWTSVILCYFGLLIFIIIMAGVLLKNKVILKFDISNVSLIAYLIFCIASVLYSVNKHTTIINNLLILSASSAFLASRKITRQKNDKLFHILFVLILSAATFVSINGIHQFFYGLDDMRNFLDMEKIKKTALLYKNTDYHTYSLYLRLISNRVFSTFVYPNSLSGYLCMILPFLFELFRQNKANLLKTYIQVVFVAVVCLSFWFYMQSMSFFIPVAIISVCVFPLSILYCLILTGSKGGLVTLIMVSSIYFAILIIRNKKNRLSVKTTLIAIILLSTLIFQVSKGKIKTLKARFDYWRCATKMIKDAPLLGFGTGTFGTIYPKYNIIDAEQTQFAHNNYIQTATETGLVSGFFFILVWLVPLIYFVKKSLKQKLPTLESAAGFSIMAFFIHGMVDFDYYIPTIAFYAFFMLGLLSSKKTDRYYIIRIKNIPLKVSLITITIIFFIYANIFMKKTVHSAIYYNSAQTYAEQDNNKAIYLTKKAIDLTPSDSKLYFFLANLYLSEENFDEAVKYYKKAVSLNRYRASYHYKLAKTLRQTGTEENLKQAILEFKKATEYNRSFKN